MEIKELGHVVLYVRDVEESASFYRDVLGFREIARSRGTALFSGGRTHHEMLLIGIGGTPRERAVPEHGLYHIGFKVGDGADILKNVYHELKGKGVRILGASDHHVTHSLYILDPDGNELELYTDITDAWRDNPLLILEPTRPLHLDE